MGAIVPRTLFKRDVAVSRPALKPAAEWEDSAIPEQIEGADRIADTVTTWIRKRSSADFLEMIQAPNRDKAHIAILRCVCHEDGQEVFESLEQAKQLEEWLFVPLMLAVNELNGFGLKNSVPRTNSGSSLPSSSAVRSRKLKRVSQRKNEPAGYSIAPDAAP